MNETADDLFEMVNLVPRLTGLPMTIWAQPRGNARHDVRIKVNMTHGRTMDPTNLATVAVWPAPWLVAGHLSPADLRLVGAWIRANETALIDYWAFTIDTDEFLARLIKGVNRATQSPACASVSQPVANTPASRLALSPPPHARSPLAPRQFQPLRDQLLKR